MKLYQMIFSVPDDFSPEKLNMSVSYEEDKEIKITSEGFIGPARMIECAPNVEIPQQAADSGVFGNLFGSMMENMMPERDPISTDNNDVEDAEVSEVVDAENDTEGNTSEDDKESCAAVEGDE